MPAAYTWGSNGQGQCGVGSYAVNKVEAVQPAPPDRYGLDRWFLGLFCSDCLGLAQAQENMKLKPMWYV